MDNINLEKSSTVEISDLLINVSQSSNGIIHILGNSGLAREIIATIKLLGSNEIKFICYEKEDESKLLPGCITFLGMGSPAIRSICHKKYKELVKFPRYVHPRANVGEHIAIGEGSFIQAGVSLTTGISIGEGCLINLNATVGHDVVIGNYSVLNPGATISGNVTIGEATMIGANATVLENLKIGSRVKVGAGAVVTRDVEDGQVVIGVPARPI